MDSTRRAMNLQAIEWEDRDLLYEIANLSILVKRLAHNHSNEELVDKAIKYLDKLELMGEFTRNKE